MSEERISLEDYLKALQLVEQYHKQIMEESETVKFRSVGISITDFLKSEPKITTRLQKVLIGYQNVIGNCSINEVLKYNFMHIRDAGEKTWDEFVQAREKFVFLCKST